MKLVFSILLLLPILAISQDKQAFRDAFELNLPINNGKFYKYTVSKSNYFVYRTDLQIYPTEELFIEVELNYTEVKSMSVVKENINPQKTLIVSFNQETKNGKSNIMVLKIHNPFPYQLSYKSSIYPTESEQWESHIPYKIQAYKTSFEMFNTPIATIVLKNWQFQ